MRILFLTKQQYMGKDVLRDRFGRFYELPKALAEQGHQIRCVCLKYWRDEYPPAPGQQSMEGVDWWSYSMGWNWPLDWLRHFRRVNDIAEGFAPDIVVGASDAVHVILSASVARKLGAPLALDLYDDFESYGATRFPGFKRGLKRGILRAAAVATVSDNLKKKVERDYRARGVVRTITNGISPEIFQAEEKSVARQKLGLPQSGILVGTAGALSAHRGTDVLIRAFEKMSRARADLFLILAGPLDRRLRLPRNDRIRYLGVLPQKKVAVLFNALDLGIVCNRSGQFAQYCFPQKFYEMIACGLPVVVANLGAMGMLLTGHEECLYQPEEIDSLIDALRRQLRTPTVPGLEIPSWHKQAEEFADLLQQASLAERSAIVAPSRRASFSPTSTHKAAQ